MTTKVKVTVICVSLLLTFWSHSGLPFSLWSNPGGVSDDFYKKYKELGAPKILYSCTEDLSRWSVCMKEGISALLKCRDKYPDEKLKYTETSYVAGVGKDSSYNKLLNEAKDECKGEFKLLESKEN
ncbi:MAG: hypothetical protein LBI87_07500 [Candidatus Accumulibacter sp.]|jgi:hypothetical protein|nr:hypothetical protein [Accumulibacter sp.]